MFAAACAGIGRAAGARVAAACWANKAQAGRRFCAHLVVDVWLLLELHLDLVEVREGVLNLELAVGLRASRGGRP